MVSQGNDVGDPGPGSAVIRLAIVAAAVIALARSPLLGDSARQG